MRPGVTCSAAPAAPFVQATPTMTASGMTRHARPVIGGARPRHPRLSRVPHHSRGCRPRPSLGAGSSSAKRGRRPVMPSVEFAYCWDDAVRARRCAGEPWPLLISAPPALPHHGGMRRGGMLLRRSRNRVLHGTLCRMSDGWMRARGLDGTRPQATADCGPALRRSRGMPQPLGIFDTTGRCARPRC